MLTQVTSLGLLFTLTMGPSQYSPSYMSPNARRMRPGSLPLMTSDQRAVSSAVAKERGHLRGGPDQPLSLRFVSEYGAVYKANRKEVLVPSTYRFRNESEVQSFQRRAGIASARIGKSIVELQPKALHSFQAARQEALSKGLSIEPLGPHASRRSYAETARLWQSKVDAGLRHWTSLGKLFPYQATRLRALYGNEQVFEVLALEGRGLYFGNRFEKPILRSVAAPGTSQHLLMLALDVKQHDSSRVRGILAKHGWFQTVKGDTPHFTYLGISEERLPTLGLKRFVSDGRTFWVPKVVALANSKRGNQEAENLGSTDGVLRQPNSESRSFSDTANKSATIKSNVTAKTTGLLGKLIRQYFKSSGHSLHITSADRSPRQQARAMYGNIVSYGVVYVLGVYRRRAAAQEIVAAYRLNRRNRIKAIDAMSRVIENQVDRNVYVSRHLLGRAFDVRLSSARPEILRRVVQSMGGQVGVEKNHYHVQF